MDFSKVQWDEHIYNCLKEHLKALAEEKYRIFHQKLVPNEQYLLGIRLPKLKALAKEIAKGDYKGYLNYAEDIYYEEVMLQGLVIGNSRCSIEEKMNLVEGFLPKINNWAICDSFCAGLKQIKKNKDYVLEQIMPYFYSENEFRVRVGVVLLLDYYIEESYLERIFTICDEIKHTGYYVKMATAWLVSVCYVKYPLETQNYLDTCMLDDWTYNKAIQKIIESNRIDGEVKEKIRKKKRTK